MQTAYERISNYSGHTEKFREWLRKFGWDSVFGELYTMYDSADLVQRVIMYVVHSYSRDSEFVLKGASWIGVKEAVARFVKLPEEQWDRIVYLGNYATYEIKRKKKQNPGNRDDFEENESIDDNADEDDIMDDTEEADLPVNKFLSVVNKWLDFQDDRDWKHYSMLADQYEEMMVASQSKLLKSGSVDFATKATCRKQAGEIILEMEQLEQKIRNRDPLLIKEARKEIKNIRPETTIPSV